MRLNSGLAAAFAILAPWPGQAFAQSKQCLEMTCFSERQVRDFEVIDRDTMVIYVGKERCPYKVKVDGLYCDLTFLPEVEFFDARRRALDERIGGQNSNDDLFGTRERRQNERVCTYDNSLALETFNFAETTAESPFRAPCEVREMSTITDDELLEVYVDEGLVPPPPPIGNGDLSRADERDEAADEPPAPADSVD